MKTRAVTYCGLVIEADGMLTCPLCSKILKVISKEYAMGPNIVEVEAVFLRKKINSKTKDWFWGCPHWPECDYTHNRAKTAEERTRETRAWANSRLDSHWGS